MKTIYLDNSATTKVRKDVVKEMEKYFVEDYGNASSIHSMGENARRAIDDSRRIIAKKINAKSEEIIFTSSATEANNLALNFDKKKKVIISSIEHDSVYECVMYLKERGYKVVEIPVDEDGLIRMEHLEREIDNNTGIVSIIHGNNEFGTLQDIETIGKICKNKGVLFHIDAVQTFSKIDIDVKRMNIDLLSASAHKIGGPKGVGFLYIKNGMKIKPLIYGGGQERGIRSGTENVPGIVGFAKATEYKIDAKKMEDLRDYFIEELENLGGKLNGARENRLFNNVNVSFSGVEGDDLVIRLSDKGIYCSTGSACNEKNDNKRVLKALGLKDKEIKGAVRFVLSEEITKKDIDYIIGEIKKILKTLKV